MLAVSGLLASSTMGWPSIFYFSGAATIIWAIFWMLFGSSSPALCKRISIEEKTFIESMPGSSHIQLKTPWLSILRSKPVIALILVHAAQCWGFWSLLTETPSYLVQIFEFEIKTVNTRFHDHLFHSRWILKFKCMFRSFFFSCIFVFSSLLYSPHTECTIVCTAVFCNVDREFGCESNI